MCGYDPFEWYEKQLDEEYEMDRLGIDNYDDYLDWKEEQAETAELEHFDEYYITLKG